MKKMLHFILLSLVIVSCAEKSRTSRKPLATKTVETQKPEATKTVAKKVATTKKTKPPVVMKQDKAKGKSSVKTKYEIYPRPQNIEYKRGSFQITDNVNVVYENGIDVYSKNRLAKILAKSGIEFSTSANIISGKTNVLVGINKSQGAVDKYFSEHVPHQDSFFSKNDSHIVSVDNNMIGVLGSDTDSAFYGITTLKHVFNQLDNQQIREFRIDDYSDVKHRGFIEGYYGNPWSNEDRAELMKFGGEYKLNTYLFAPKDDIYHNKKWRELYPPKELAEIKKLAKVGNETKNKYVFALHPFMHHAIRFDTETNYQNDLNIIKAKFTQLLKNDVRAFCILADDAGVPRQGPKSYVKLLKDMTNWLIEQKNTYPDLVTDIPFCSNDYMGNGSSGQLREVNRAPKSVSIIMTGGRIWGEVSKHFTSNFKKNIGSGGLEGRPPYLWINWPCSDNSKQHLIMGGNDTFLHPGVNPENIQGIVLNPMQQAEANKSAIFAISDYAWNIWDNNNQANQNWHDSFKYMNHGTSEETKTSTALREICKHMINQNMDGRVRALEESVELAPKLRALRDKLKAGTLQKQDTAPLIKEFEVLQEQAEYYRNNPGNKRTQEQIVYWLNCWRDTTTAAINYLHCLNAMIDGNKDNIWNYYSTAQAAFEKSKTYKFWYINHYERAEVGVQHIVPFIKAMGQHLNEIVSGIVDPAKVIESYITNREDTPSGDIKNISDGNAKTEVVYKSPNSIQVGEYLGLKYSNPKHITSIEFLLGANSNPQDTFAKSRIEITKDGKTWTPLDGKVYTSPNEVKVDNLDIKVRGIRMIAIQAKGNTWLGLRTIVINEEGSKSSSEDYALTAKSSNNIAIRMGGGVEGIVDGNTSAGPSFAFNPYQGPNRDTTPVDAFVQIDLEEVKTIGKVTFVQAQGDRIKKANLEYSVDGTTWKTLKKFDNATASIEFDASGLGITAKSLRLKNLEETRKWWQVKDFRVAPPKTKASDKGYTNTDNELSTIVSLEQTKLLPAKGIKLKPNEYVGVKLERIKDLKSISRDITNTRLTLQVSENAVEWQNIISGKLPDGRYIRLINKTRRNITFDINKFEVNSNEIHPIKCIKEHAKTYNNSKPEQAFDGNFNSTVFFNKGFNRGESIVYDLGQIIHIDNLKYVVFDTDTDHVRDGRFQLSLNGKTWTDAFATSRLTDDNNAKPQDNGYKHGSLSNGVIPISHAYLEGDNLDKKARYLRILATDTYSPRWIRISEILINNGKYIKLSNNPTYISTPIELKNHGPEKMFDGDLTSSYRPDTLGGKIKSGSVIYKLSENTNVGKINIVQDRNTISNAKLMVRTGKKEWHQLGTLDKSLNEISNRKYKNIFEIKIEWRGKAPNIYEIVPIANSEGESE